MMKSSILWIFTLVVFAFACEKKPAETQSSANSKDTSKKQEVAVATTNPEVQLSGNSKIIAKKWYAMEVETANTKLSSELTDIKFDFKSDGTFEYFEDGKKEAGTWKSSDENKMILIEYNSPKRKADYNVQEIKDDKLVIAGKDNSMYRTYKLAPSK